MRVFYVLPITHQKAAACLDGIRFICNPREKTSTHITVRGPYRQHYRLDRANAVIRGAMVRIEGVGSFFSSRQNTVYLSAHSKAIKLIWYKPDYNDFHPHVTIYDGASRTFANQLISILNAHPIQFSFRAEKLEALVTNKGQADSFFRLKIDFRLLSRITEQQLDPDRIAQATDSRRLQWIEQITQYITETNRPISSVRQSQPLQRQYALAMD